MNHEQRTLIKCAQTLAEGNPSLSPIFLESTHQKLQNIGNIPLISEKDEYRITTKGKGKLAELVVRYGRTFKLSIKEIREL